MASQKSVFLAVVCVLGAHSALIVGVTRLIYTKNTYQLVAEEIDEYLATNPEKFNWEQFWAATHKMKGSLLLINEFSKKYTYYKHVGRVARK